MMNSNELKNAIRDTAVDMLLNISPDLRMVEEKPYTFVLPVEIEGATYYAKIGLTSCQLQTKAKDAYDAADTVPAAEGVEHYREERAALAAMKEAEKASKPKKSSKKKSEDDE